MGAGVLDGRTLLAIFRIELGAGSWKIGERYALDLKIPDQKGIISCSMFEPNTFSAVRLERRTE
jgi:hypothetical protein